MDSVFKATTQDERYITYWVTLLDNYMHEYHVLGDEWLRFRKQVEQHAESKRLPLLTQFVQKNVAEKFVSTFGSGTLKADAVIPEESISAFSEVLLERLSSESLRYV